MKNKRFAVSSDENEFDIHPDIRSRFLQVLIFQPVLKVEKAVEILSTLSKKQMSIASMERIVKGLNPQLSRYYQMVKCVLSDITGEKYLVLVNTVSNPFTLSIPTYSDNEMKMFSLIIDQLICGEHAGGITTIDILNLSSQITPPISKSEAEQIMKKLVREDWLHNEYGTIYFGVRTTAEMTPLLLDHYRDFIRVCSRCKSVALTSVSCNNKECSAVLHFHCLEKFKEIDPDGYCCLGCGQKLSFD